MFTSDYTYTVQYRCQYREHWYDQADGLTWAQAMATASTLVQTTGRMVRILGWEGNVVWESWS